MAIVYLDTNVFILAFESRVPLAQPARDLLLVLDRFPGVGVTSELTLGELFAPAKAAHALSVPDKFILYDALLGSGPVFLSPITRAVLRETALLRLSFPQKLPDAIHVATAVLTGCHFLVTSDDDLKRVPPQVRRVMPDREGVRLLSEALGA